MIEPFDCIKKYIYSDLSAVAFYRYDTNMLQLKQKDSFYIEVRTCVDRNSWIHLFEVDTMI